jgi:acetyl esterase/lipase
LAAAISYIFKKAEMFKVSVENYSLWGSSAGARMVGNIGKGGYDLPKPRMVVIAYTGQTSFSKNFPPVFLTVSEDDKIVNGAEVDRRVKNMRNAGIEVEYRKYKKAGHGFGLGVGTDAEGWIEYAIRFWGKHSS